jgi:hypothetical protein
MPHEIGFVENAGTLAHYMMLDKIKTFAEANGYTILRYDTAIANRELIMMAPGFSGTEEIYMGFRCYQNAGADYYNMTVAAFIGYVPGNSFETQPGAMLSGIPAHNNRIDYWLTLNPQRIALAMKVGTPVYESAYVGKFLPYASPGQFPLPIVCAGMLSGEPATRFSDVTHSIPYKGSRGNFLMRFNTGSWIQPSAWPWNNVYIARQGTSTQQSELRDVEGYYSLHKVMLTGSGNIYGELDGISYISGFNNAVENTLEINSESYVVIQDVSRTGFIDYYAMRLDD